MHTLEKWLEFLGEKQRKAEHGGVHAQAQAHTSLLGQSQESGHYEMEIDRDQDDRSSLNSSIARDVLADSTGSAATPGSHLPALIGSNDDVANIQGMPSESKGIGMDSPSLEVLPSSTVAATPSPEVVSMNTAKHFSPTPMASAFIPAVTSPSSKSPTTATEDLTAHVHTPGPATTASDMATTALAAATLSLNGIPTKTPATDS